jgi:uncharacterized membrane-anchored protein
MIEVLRVVAGSWPLAVMFLGAVAGGIALYIVRWFKQANREDKAYRATQAVVVRQHEENR